MIYPSFTPTETEVKVSKVTALFQGIRILKLLCTITGALFLLTLITTSISPNIRLHMGSAIASVLPESSELTEDIYLDLDNTVLASLETDVSESSQTTLVPPKNLDTIHRLYSNIEKLSPSELVNIKKLTPYIANRYRVSEDMTRTIVKNSFLISQDKKIDPLLLLAVISVESRFNPVAESNKGAQGLMQVMSNVHVERFKKYGGKHTALDPLVNMLVGTAILNEYIKKGGGVEGGLRRYVGATGGRSDGGYGAKVASEYAKLTKVIGAPAVLFAPRSNDPEDIAPDTTGELEAAGVPGEALENNPEAASPLSISQGFVVEN